MKKKIRHQCLLICLAVSFLFFAACGQIEMFCPTGVQESADSISEIPEYEGKPYIAIDENEPDFTEKEKTQESFEQYSELDSLGRCGVAYANIGQELMPTEKRGSIGKVKPTGWHTMKYDIVDGKYLLRQDIIS